MNEIANIKIYDKGGCSMSILKNAISKIKAAVTKPVNKAQATKSKPINTKDSVKISTGVREKSKTSAPSLKKDATPEKIGSNSGRGNVPGFKGTTEPKHSSFRGKASHDDLWKGTLMPSTQESFLDKNGFTVGKGKKGDRTSFEPLPRLHESKGGKKPSKSEEGHNVGSTMKEGVGTASTVLGDASSNNKIAADIISPERKDIPTAGTKKLNAASSLIGAGGNAIGAVDSLSKGDLTGAAKDGAAFVSNTTSAVDGVRKWRNLAERSGLEKGLKRTGKSFGLISGGIGLAKSIKKGDAGSIVENSLKTAEGAMGTVDAFKKTELAKTSLESVKNIIRGGAKTASGSVDDVASTGLKASGAALKKAPVIGVAISAVEGGNTALKEAEKKHGKLKDKDKAVIAGLGAAGGAAGALSGAAAGAAIGSIIPGPGTAIGAVVGGVVGFLLSDAGAKAGGELGQKIVGLK